jgi:hypothetical protein
MPKSREIGNQPPMREGEKTEIISRDRLEKTRVDVSFLEPDTEEATDMPSNSLRAMASDIETPTGTEIDLVRPVDNGKFLESATEDSTGQVGALPVQREGTQIVRLRNTEGDAKRKWKEEQGQPVLEPDRYEKSKVDFISMFGTEKSPLDIMQGPNKKQADQMILAFPVPFLIEYSGEFSHNKAHPFALVDREGYKTLESGFGPYTRYLPFLESVREEVQEVLRGGCYGVVTTFSIGSEEKTVPTIFLQRFAEERGIDVSPTKIINPPRRELPESQTEAIAPQKKKEGWWSRFRNRST